MHPKTLAAAVLWCWVAAVHGAAPVEANLATEAQLDSVRGIGPATSARILAARSSAPFKDWNDLIARVPGIGKGTATKLSAEGLMVNGEGFAGASPAPARTPDPRPAPGTDSSAPPSPPP
ncbi:helix-hairpin-helix domain-containing protein [Paracidovorax wautersii]|uniref:ComEA family DNA-binding protein n=1 Tax=Paracidovorax wautersii TaxID=1177982 RepID=UPI0031DF383D